MFCLWWIRRTALTFPPSLTVLASLGLSAKFSHFKKKTFQQNVLLLNNQKIGIPDHSNNAGIDFTNNLHCDGEFSTFKSSTREPFVFVFCVYSVSRSGFLHRKKLLISICHIIFTQLMNRRVHIYYWFSNYTIIWILNSKNFSHQYDYLGDWAPRILGT